MPSDLTTRAREAVQDIDRRSSAKMFEMLGRPSWAVKCLDGTFDHFPHVVIVRALAAYRVKVFEGKGLLNERDALDASADYLDERWTTLNFAFEQCPNNPISEGLRKGFRYDDPNVRVFLYHNRKCTREFGFYVQESGHDIPDAL